MVSKGNWRVLVLVTGILGLYAFFLWGLSTNPPGSYLDESAGAYNAYLIATTGRGEFGHWFQVFPQFYTQSAIEYSNPVHIYILALMYLVVPPSVLSARVCLATMTFIAVIVLGILAKRISGRLSIGIIVTLTAVATPWIFEPSRLILECAVYPLALSLLLLAVYSAISKESWSLLNCVLIALGLAATTYTYTIGRLLGPLLGLGLLIFVRNRSTFLSVVKTGLIYTVTMIPFFVVYFGRDTATRRFKSITWFDWGQPWSVLFGRFWDAYTTDISPKFLLEQGDPLLRHHIPGTGEMLAATLALAMVGLIVVILRHWRERWWWYIIYGLLIGVLPGALTVQRYHSLRTMAVPVFLLILTIPPLMWLLGPPRNDTQADDTFRKWFAGLKHRIGGLAGGWRQVVLNRDALGYLILGVVLVLTFKQAYSFQVKFREVGPTRDYAYDAAYRSAFEHAVALPSRPIYLEDGYWGPAYVHALWYATIKSIDRSEFVHLAERERAPVGGLVISSNEECSRCEIIARHGSYLLYRVEE